MLADTGRLTEILDDLLMAADTRADADRSETDLASLVRECVEAASGAADVAAVHLGCEADRPVVVDGVAPALRRAVTALVDNALDHAATRVDVRVEAVRPHRPGGGPRRRTRHRRRRAAPGASSGSPARGPPRQAGARRHYGIGLALVADVAAAHGGTVAARNRADGVPGAELDA